MTETTQALTLQPYAGLKSLNKLVGTWNVSGPDIKGQVIFEWMEGGFFLIQHVGFVHTGRRIAGIEIIGYELPFGAEQPSEQIKSHWFGSGGETFEYTYEADDETLTIWGGEKGSLPITRASGAQMETPMRVRGSTRMVAMSRP